MNGDAYLKEPGPRSYSRTRSDTVQKLEECPCLVHKAEEDLTHSWWRHTGHSSTRQTRYHWIRLLRRVLMDPEGSSNG